MGFKTTLIHYLKMIKIENSLFSTPFAIAAMFLAAGGMPRLTVLFLVIFCVITLRSGATGFNRWYWADIDAKNPRTRKRAIPSGRLPSTIAFVFVLISFALFILGAYQLNPLCFYLSPVPIILFVAYTILRKYSTISHLILGIAAGIAPLGGYIAVTGSFDIQRVTTLTIAVVAWYMGFDLFYAIRDADFEREESMASIPAAFGVLPALALARGLQLVAFFLFFLHGAEYSMRWIYFGGLLLSGAILAFEHYKINKYGPSSLNSEFFYTRGIISTVLCVAMVIDIVVY